ncbi:unnamed protein product [Acanthoscelides obtectus]|nr:unnamed protein product [Acanthoscelides obtectus]CAK1668640.1 3-phosphoinositide-dependent protein kinase 1 [Acanthoscelides obtectus]
MLSESSSSPASDLWALGCIIYQMVSGVMPFRGRSEFLIFQKILNLEYEYPDGFDPQAKDLVQKLLVKNPIERLGATDEAPYTSIRFVEGNLILKQGLIDKKKGLFARRRMFLLTFGPHLYYVDPVAMVLKGEIPWSEDLRSEAKNFKTFFIHTPNRKYYLEDPEGYALQWCKAIDEVKAYYHPEQ